MKKAILLTCFGTSYKDAIERCIYPIKQGIEKEFPDNKVFIVFTSRVIREKLLLKYDRQVFSMEGALKRLSEGEYSEVTILPLQLMEGREQKALEELCTKYKSSFKCLSLLKPLLSLDEKENLINIDLIIPFMEEMKKVYGNIVFVGHGIKNNINIPFKKLEEELLKRKLENIYFFTIEGEPSFKEVCEKIKCSKVDNITLLSFLMVSGYHSNKDIFGYSKETYYNKLEILDIEVDKDEISLGERKEIVKIYINLLRINIDKS